MNDRVYWKMKALEYAAEVSKLKNKIDQLWIKGVCFGAFVSGAIVAWALWGCE